MTTEHFSFILYIHKRLKFRHLLAIFVLSLTFYTVASRGNLKNKSESNSVLVITHATAEWDENLKARPAVNAAIKLFNQYALPKIAVFSYWNEPSFLSNLWHGGKKDWKGVIGSKRFIDTSYFPAGIFMGKTLSFENSLGEIYPESNRDTTPPELPLITKSKNFFIVGGNWLECSCRSVRDIIKHKLNHQKSVTNIYFVVEGIYEYSGLRIDTSSDIYEYRGRSLLSEIYASTDDNLFGNLVTHYYLICLGSRIANGNYKFQIWRNNKIIQSVNEDSNLINLHFISVSELSNLVNKLNNSL